MVHSIKYKAKLYSPKAVVFTVLILASISVILVHLHHLRYFALVYFILCFLVLFLYPLYRHIRMCDGTIETDKKFIKVKYVFFNKTIYKEHELGSDFDIGFNYVGQYLHILIYKNGKIYKHKIASDERSSDLIEDASLLYKDNLYYDDGYNKGNDYFKRSLYLVAIILLLIAAIKIIRNYL